MRSSPLTLLDAVATGLRRAGHAFAALDPLPGFGVAHDHVRVGHGKFAGFAGDYPVLVRVPRAPFAALTPSQSLEQQAAVFVRAAASRHVPRLVGLLTPSDALPLGALIVEEIIGTPPALARDHRALAGCLAHLHALPMPPAGERAPVPDADDPIAALLDAVEAQAAYLAPAGASAGLRAAVDAERAMLRDWVRTRPRHGKALVLTDTHPGNFVVTADRHAIAVDLEKGLYGLPAIDLAHATLATSTLWDPSCAGRLTADQVLDFHVYYVRRLRTLGGGALVKAMLPLLSPIRRLVWMRTTTWMARFKAGGGLDRPSPYADHLVRYVDWALSAAAAEEIREEWLSQPSLGQQVQERL